MRSTASVKLVGTIVQKRVERRGQYERLERVESGGREWETYSCHCSRTVPSSYEHMGSYDVLACHQYYDSNRLDPLNPQNNISSLLLQLKYQLHVQQLMKLNQQYQYLLHQRQRIRIYYLITSCQLN
jgi:hypothetical protein